MTEPNQPTLQNPAKPDLRSLLTALGLESRKQVNCARIGIIQSFNPANQTVTVQVAQQQVLSTSPEGVQNLAPFPPLVSVPVFFPCGGGFTLTFPIAPGDECLVIFNDREIDNWLLSGGDQTTPTTARIHDMADGMAFVGFRSFPRSLNPIISTSSTQLRSDDGKTYVEVADGGIVNAVAPVSINLTAPQVNVNASNSFNVNTATENTTATRAINHTTPTETISGIIDVQNVNGSSSPCVITGAIKATGDIIAGSGSTNTSLQNHVHSGVQTGSGDTGPPV